MTAPVNVSANSTQIVAAIRAKYPAPGHATFAEVANGTGAHANRHADAIVCSLFPSSGLWIAGFEVKISRGDWLRELKQPEKADAIARHCNYWWVAVSDAKIVDVDEMPPAWGLMVLAGETLRIKKQAKYHKLDAAVDRKFACALFRAAETYANSPARVAHLTEKIRDDARESAKYHLQDAQRNLRELKQRVVEFREASGIDIEHEYGSIPKLGAIVKRMLNVERQYRSDSIDGTISTCRAYLAELERLSAAFAEAQELVARECGLEPVKDKSAIALVHDS